MDFKHKTVLVGAYIEIVSEEIEHNHNESRSVQECFNENTSIHFEVDEDSLSEQAKKDVAAGSSIEIKQFGEEIVGLGKDPSIVREFNNTSSFFDEKEEAVEDEQFVNISTSYDLDLYPQPSAIRSLPQ